MSSIQKMKVFKWNPEKKEILATERGITFEEIVYMIEAGVPVIETDHRPLFTLADLRLPPSDVRPPTSEHCLLPTA